MDTFEAMYLVFDSDVSIRTMTFTVASGSFRYVGCMEGPSTMRLVAWLLTVSMLIAGCAATSQDQQTAALTDLAANHPPASSTTGAALTPTAPSRPWGVPAFSPRPAPSPWIDPRFAGIGTVTIAEGGAALAAKPGGPSALTAREGLTFPALGWDREWIMVQTTCDDRLYVHRSQVRADAAAPSVTIGNGFALSEAVIVIDPGHGGPRNIGGVGPQGTTEKEVNLDIAGRVRSLLESPHSVDWASGLIYSTGSIPAAKRVILTRSGQHADYEVRLDARAELANAANAQVFVSIHNNAGWAIELNTPGSDTYYQSQERLRPDSERLAVLIAEEFQRSFRRFDANWTGGERTGAKSRLSSEHPGDQFYGVLRYSAVPAVIAEGAYINSVTQEQLLLTPKFRQAYADAVYRALVRFLTTDDKGDAPSWPPETYPSTRGNAGSANGCVVPSQP